MTTTTIRVSTKTQQTLCLLAAQASTPMQDIVDQAVELYRRNQLLDATNAAYAAIRAQPVVWQELTDADADWDATLADGLPED